MTRHKGVPGNSWMGEFEKTNRMAMLDGAHARRVAMMRFAMFGATPVGGGLLWMVTR